jgi:glycosyltransferase involved in cell wall biosynthesis
MDTSVASISVAMATYNGHRHIRRQLDSLAAQSHLPTELVVTDDSPNDDTAQIIDAFAKTAPFPVRIWRNETRLGYRANFMHAANLCKSELIAFCDQDDYWHPDKIAMSIAPFGDPEVLLAYHNADVVTGEGARIGTLAGRAAPRPILTPMSSAPWWPYPLGFTQVFRRSLLPLSDLWPSSIDQQDASEPLAHDQWFYFLASVFGRIAYLDEPLADYVQHGNNTYGWGKPSFRKSIKMQFRDRSEEYSRYTRAAQSRMTILEIAKTRFDGVWAERAAAAVEHYRKVSWLYSERRALYASAKLTDRLNAFRAVLRQGGYAGAWGFGRRSLVVDACVGVAGYLLRSSTEL